MTKFRDTFMGLRANGTFSKYALIMIFSTALILSYSVAGSTILKKTSATINDPFQITNDQVKDSYLVYIKEKINKGPNSECHPGLGVGVLQGDDINCNAGMLNQQKKLNGLENQVEELDDGIVSKLSDKLEKKKEVLSDKFEKLRERMEKAISEEEEEKPLPEDVQKLIDKEDQETINEHQSKEGENCRDGNVLDGASNEEDLKVLAECQDAVGDVMHTKKMDDGDYKFLLKLDDKYEFLVNDKNEEKTDGLLVVEVVPKDQDLNSVDLPKEGDKVHVWGAWVTDKPKGWHEIHPTWEVVKQ
ncbi:MAG TPA: hypothetical protein VE548_05375 [Nitrososphaeraceae archaeon]|nr:hypothetical protein [Nitrososphaeraceae archaeon]